MIYEDGSRISLAWTLSTKLRSLRTYYAHNMALLRSRYFHVYEVQDATLRLQ